jgi:hypothetical protein
MKALTICQPYAELIARGDKPIENRTWPTSYRGPLAIHAGKSRAWLGDEDEEAALYAVDVRRIAFGAVVAVADLVACLPAQYPADTYNWPASWRHLSDHEHANGPWCWVLENVRRIDPVFVRGAQGLWELPMALAAVDPHAGVTTG